MKMNKQWRAKTIMISQVIIGFLCITVVAILVLSGTFMTPKYLEPWEKNYSQQFDDPRLSLVAHGVLAPNGHNVQPWKIRLDKNDANVFYLYADSNHLTKGVDPFARQAMISQGTFLEYVKIAGEKLGYKIDIVFFPDGTYNEQDLINSMQIKPVAQITIAQDELKKESLYDFMFFPDTNRAVYKNNKLTSEQMNYLIDNNTDDTIAVKLFQDEQNVIKIGKYVVNGALIESSVHRINEETAPLFRLNEYQKNLYRYGFSVEGQGIVGIRKHVVQGIVTLLPFLNNEKNSADVFITATRKAADHTPVYAMIMSSSNNRTAQVKAGMVYSRLVLTAHSWGFALQPTSQALEEYPEMKGIYDNIHRDYADNGSTIQMLVRIGMPMSTAERSMRRNVRELLIY